MPSNKTQKGKTASRTPQPQQLQELYDLLMAQIEPELVTAEISYLDFYYFGEMEDDRNKRMERYAKAFVLLEERMGVLFKQWEKNIGDYKRKVVAEAKGRAVDEEKQEISDLSSKIENA
jgi:hypothetical protein